MNGETKDLINYKLMRSKETLDDAKILFENGKLFSTVNRIYYTMFYIVNGLLLTKGLSSTKHSGILGLFNKEFVNKGIVEKELGRFYNEMFGFRQKADYKDLVRFDKENVKAWLSNADEFVSQVDSLISRIITAKDRG